MHDPDLFLMPLIPEGDQALSALSGVVVPNQSCAPGAQDSGEAQCDQRCVSGMPWISSVNKFWYLCCAGHWVWETRWMKKAWSLRPDLNLGIRTTLCKPWGDPEIQGTHRLCWRGPKPQAIWALPVPCPLWSPFFLYVHWLQRESWEAE